MDRPEWSRLFRHQALILLTAGIVFFTNLGAASLFDEDEPKNAVCGREMFLRGDWIVPTFNDGLRTDKPILIYWLMLCSYHLLGVSEFAARLGSSLLAVGTSLTTYHLGRKLFRPEVGLWGALILCSCLMFSAVGRAVTPDSTLIFCTTLAFTGYVWAVAARHGGQFGSEAHYAEQSRSWEEFAPLNWKHALPMYAAMGFAVLAKGPVGYLLPCAIIGLNLLVRQQIDFQNSLDPNEKIPFGVWVFRTLAHTFYPSRFGGAVLAMQLPIGTLLVCAIALPWYIAVGVQTDGEWLAGFLGNHNVGRYLEAKENHSGPIFYYAIVIFMGCFPWSVFLPLSVLQLRRRLKVGSEWSPGYVFLACWAGYWISFFSTASTKLPNYILPAYPAVALLIACFVHDWQREPAHVLGGWFRFACGILTAIGLGMMAVMPFVTSLLLPDEAWLAGIGLIPAIGGIVAIVYSLRDQRKLAMRTFATTAVTLAVAIVAIAPARIAKYQDGPTFGRLVKAEAGNNLALATFEYFAPNLVFYSEHHVHQLQSQQDVTRFFNEHPEGYLLTRQDKLDKIEDRLPADITVVAQQRRFLRRHDLVLMRRKSVGEQASAAASEIQPVAHTVVE